MMPRVNDRPADALTEARALDAADPLRALRAEFHIPKAGGAGAHDCVYLVGNSLGLMPRSARAAVDQELDDWASMGVHGHFKSRDNWYRYHELVREPLARLAGALPHEVVAMNSLTVNLHSMLVSFYRPERREGGRRAIVIDTLCFPSDVYAVKSHLRLHGIPEPQGLIRLSPRAGEHTIRSDDVLEMLAKRGPEIALVMLGGVNFVTGDAMDIERISKSARDAGCRVGWDLAHAVGNIPLRLHDSGADFAVWCSYKYLNSGPGAVGGCFVHERHTLKAAPEARASMPRLEGWWGNDPDSRFRMGDEFTPVASADAWQLSNPPIFSLAPLRASLALFERAGMEALRAKSVRLTAFFERLLLAAGDRCHGRLRLITPREASARGCQLAVQVPGAARPVVERLEREGVMCDAREPGIVRAAPVPLYNTFEDCCRAAEAFERALA